MTSIDRRTFLQNTIVSSGYLFGLGAFRPAWAGPDPRRFAPVKVARNRVIRQIVGLRPYRPEGFVVQAEKIGQKLLIHNYGHGGAGITLAWGTAVQAVELARDFQPSAKRSRRALGPSPRRFAVIGSGVNGLSTARMLQRRFQDGPGTVTIYAKDLPPNTTSNIAAGFWMPVYTYEFGVASDKFLEQFRSASRISHREYQLLVGAQYGVRWIDTFAFSRNEPAAGRQMPGGNDLYPEQILHRDPDHYFGYPYVQQYSTMLIEPSIYLSALLRDFYNAGGRLVVREFRDREEVMRLPEPVIFNCSGLGARSLFGDEKLVPARGQFEILQPQPEIDYCYLGPGHMFPRSDGIILGGTFDLNDWSLDVRRDQADWILNTHAEIMKGLKS